MRGDPISIAVVSILAACSGVRGVQTGAEAPTIHIEFLDPGTLTRGLEAFLRPREVRPVIDVRQRLQDPDFNGAWESIEPWERQLWREYAARGGGSVDSKRTNFHVTKTDRLLMALNLSFQHVDTGAREEGQRLIYDPAFVGGLVGGVCLYVGLWAFPEPFFSKGVASTITIALLMQFSVEEIRSFAWAWSALEVQVGPARTLAELDLAGARFGKAAGAQGIHVLMMIAGTLAGKAVARLPVPTGSGGPPLAAAAAGHRLPAGVVVAAGQEIWVLAGGEIALVGPGAIAVAMSAGGDVENESAPRDRSPGIDLHMHEAAGGHLISRHVQKTQAELLARLASELASWLASPSGVLVLQAPFRGGLLLERGAVACVEGHAVRLVIRADGAGGWYIRTGYPVP